MNVIFLFFVLLLPLRSVAAEQTTLTQTVTAGTTSKIPSLTIRLLPELTLHGDAGTITTVEWSSTLGPDSSWQVLTNVTMGANGSILVDLTVGASTRFYRAVQAVISNVAPVANAGVSQTLYAGTLVRLDGSGSSDADGDSLSYKWNLTTKPVGSAARVSGNGNIFSSLRNPTITPDLVGTYVVSLIVNDGKLSSESVTVSITATVNPSAPSTPPAPTLTAITSNSITFSWEKSTGGAGGVYDYTFYGNGGRTTRDVTTWTDVNLTPDTTYEYSVVATSVSGARSQPSPRLIAKTLPFSLMKAKFSPYIVFEIATGKIRSQCFASPQVVAAAKVPTASGYDVIQHERIDTNLYGIKTLGERQYSIYEYATNVPLEPQLSGAILGTANADHFEWMRVDSITGAAGGGGSGGGPGVNEMLMLNLGNSWGCLVGEIL